MPGLPIGTGLNWLLDGQIMRCDFRIVGTDNDIRMPGRRDRDGGSQDNERQNPSQTHGFDKGEISDERFLVHP